MKPSLPRRCLVGFGIALLALPALAATRPATPSSSPPMPAMLASLAAAGKVKVVSQFATEVPGIRGYIISSQDGTQVVYGDHGYLFVGHIITPKGTDLTDTYSPKPDLGKVISKLDAGGHLINEGPSTAPILYVFADPNCSFCYRFYKMAEPLVSSGRLQLRWVMVAFLQASSAAKATAILSSSDPRAALHADEDRFDVTHESGGIAPASKQDMALQQVLQAHVSAMDALGAQGTPTLLYRDARGHWSAQVGLPPDDWLTQYSQGKPLPQPAG